MSDASVPVIVLAAGGSERFGTPKQLAPWHGTTLLRHAVRTALDAGTGPVIVMLGAHAPALRDHLADSGVTCLEHSSWREGMGSTIARAAAHVSSHWPAAAGLIVMACDQPRVTDAHLRALVDRHRELRCEAVASAYAGTIGIPALFDGSLATRLSDLQGDRGARLLLESVRTESVALPGGELDIDRPSDTQST